MLGILGGTGLYEIDGLQIEEELSVETPFGLPSAPVVLGILQGRRIAFLPRHGRSHTLSPSEVNYRANIFTLKKIGVRTLLSISAVGSLREDIQPGSLVIPDQYIDYTKSQRDPSFFGRGLIAHVSTAEPVCSQLRAAITELETEAAQNIKTQSTYVCIEGPRLGTKAESRMFRDFGADIVGMTNVPEAFLARDAQICYASLCVVTDYDAWHDAVAVQSSVASILALYKESLSRIKIILKALCAHEEHNDVACTSCRSALEAAVLTPRSVLNEEQLSFLEVLER
jgi:5'-methylthioadenosine phosphorylase